MEPPWKRANRHRKSQKQEQELGRLPESRQQPNSGRGRFAKRDARVRRNFLVEARTTDSQSYTISKKEFKDIERQAIRTPPGCLPAMQVTIDGLRLWVMRDQDFQDREDRLMLLEDTPVG